MKKANTGDPKSKPGKPQVHPPFVPPQPYKRPGQGAGGGPAIMLALPIEARDGLIRLLSNATHPVSHGEITQVMQGLQGLPVIEQQPEVPPKGKKP